MSWTTANSALILALIGIICGVIGYFYRARNEQLRNYRLALFIILRIWHRFGLLSRDNFGLEFDFLFSRVQQRCPDAKISDEEIKAIKCYFSPFMKKILINRAFEGFESIEAAWDESVRLVSLHDPIFGYELSSISSIRSRLAAMDQYFAAAFGQLDQDDHPETQLVKRIQSKAKSFAHKDAILDIESAIKRLSRKIGILTNLKVQKVLENGKTRLAKIPENETQKIVDEILVPFIQDLHQHSSYTSPAPSPDTLQAGVCSSCLPGNG